MDPENEWRIYIRNLSGTAGNEPVSKQIVLRRAFLYRKTAEAVSGSSIANEGRYPWRKAPNLEILPNGIVALKHKENK